MSCPGSWSGPRCSVPRLRCVPGDSGGPCGRHGECRHHKLTGSFHCACHLWWKGEKRKRSGHFHTNVK